MGDNNLSIKILKKMFLKVLFEFRNGGQYAHYSHDFHGIIRDLIPKFFNLGRQLTNEEYARGLQAVKELENAGYIRQDPSQSAEVFKELTGKGKRYAEMKLEDMTLPNLDINEVLTNQELKESVMDDFLNSDFDSAIFKAYKYLEETIRTKAELDNSFLGTKLVNKAFNPITGMLLNPEATTDSEKEGLHLLLLGAIKWFKNPQSHRTVGYSNPETCIQSLAFANLLIDLVLQSKKR